MKHRTACIFGLAALAPLVACAPVAAESLGSGAAVLQPLLLRISGFTDGAPQGTSTLGSFTLGVDHKVVTLELSAVQTLNGPLTEGSAALGQFDLFHPNLLLVGDRELLRNLAGAMPHTPVTLFGYVHPGARRMYVVQVETGRSGEMG
jgi:hypothetical protein